MRKMLRDTWVLFIHYLKMELRNPFWMLAALFQPVCYLYLFAPLLKNLPVLAAIAALGAIEDER